MAQYALSRHYRPQRFSEVFAQDAVIATLQHAVLYNKIGAAYLFAGSKGTGKTTVARIFAKALNCSQSQEGEPCNVCASCREIQGGNSLDVIEIDGASHRGIEDIRSLNESVGFAPARGRYRIYIIDEVHMLTKEAFNALLKTLEEPPRQTVFFFATTEFHKIPDTILSRCQKFFFSRIAVPHIIRKLEWIAQQEQCLIDQPVFELIARMASGGMRDAESLLDQLLAYNAQRLSYQDVTSLLGMDVEEIITAFDDTCKNERYQEAFVIADQVFFGGRNVTFFLDTLLQHFQRYLRKQSLDGSQPPYSEEMVIEVLELIMQAQKEIKHALDEKVFLEILLLRIIKKLHTISYTSLIKRLEALEQRTQQISYPSSVPPPSQAVTQRQDDTPLHYTQARKDTLLQFAIAELNNL